MLYRTESAFIHIIDPTKSCNKKEKIKANSKKKLQYILQYFTRVERVRIKDNIINFQYLFFLISLTEFRFIP